MTTLIAVHDPAVGTIIGSDTKINLGGFVTYERSGTGKWIEYNGYAIGCAGSSRIAVEIEQNVVSLLPKGCTVFEFASNLREHLSENDEYQVNIAEEGGFDQYNGLDLIFATANEVWKLDGCLTPVYIAIDGVTTAGSGFGFCLAAYLGLGGSYAPEIRVTHAINIAGRLDVNSGGEVWVKTLPIVKEETKDTVVTPFRKKEKSGA